MRRVKYGLTKNINTYNPLRIAYHEMADIARDVRTATGLAPEVGHVFGRPGWTPAPHRRCSESDGVQSRLISLNDCSSRSVSVQRR